jgi:hypothetical protein
MESDVNKKREKPRYKRVLRQNLQMNQRGERKVGRELPESVAEPEGVDKLSEVGANGGCCSDGGCRRPRP